MTFIVISVIILILLMIYAAVMFNLFTPPVKGLPVLMYHKIEDGKNDGLTVSSENFEKQLAWLKIKGYKSLLFSEIKNIGQNDPLPSGAVVLTFDDAYFNFLTTALPILRKYGFSAAVFLPVGHAGKVNQWDKGSDRILNFDELKSIVSAGDIEIGLHSYSHKSYGDMTTAEMEDDIIKCRETLKKEDVPHIEVLAYPYGGYPRKDLPRKEEMIRMFRKTGLDFALRIGNRINRWPLQHPYEIQRIDIRGTDSFCAFKIKVRKGRVRMFT